jgi:hypothetical protein
MKSRFAQKAGAIGALFLIATAAQAQQLHGGTDYDPAYAAHFGFATGSTHGPYAYDDSYGYNSNSSVLAEDRSYCARHHRAYNPATGAYLGHDGHRRSCP